VIVRGGRQLLPFGLTLALLLGPAIDPVYAPTAGTSSPSSSTRDEDLSTSVTGAAVDGRAAAKTGGIVVSGKANGRSLAVLRSGPADLTGRNGSARRGRAARQPQAEYDGSYTFTRIRYGSSFRRRGWGSAWNHDYPSADLNMQSILREFTSMRPTLGATNVLDLEDPEIFRYPILYMAEPGFWSITQEGARNLRQHLLKGGLIIFDDFEADQWYNFADQLQRALPEYEFIEIDGNHAVFQSFYRVDDIYVPHPFVRVTPRYFGMFEDNDPDKRMLALVNYNADLAEYWEWSGQGFFPVDPTTDAYKLGVNYIIYGLTH
jgi:hypothetical protein